MWEPSEEPDLEGYFVYRARYDDGVGDGCDRGVRLNQIPLPVAALLDAGVEPGATYAYVVTAVDRAGNESADSSPAMILVAGGDPPDPSPSVRFAAFPNPARESATFAWSSGADGTAASIRIIAPDGRVVAYLTRPGGGSATHTLTWDIRDRLGGPVADGVYLCELETAAGELLRAKLTVVR